MESLMEEAVGTESRDEMVYLVESGTRSAVLWTSASTGVGLGLWFFSSLLSVTDPQLSIAEAAGLGFGSALICALFVLAALWDIAIAIGVRRLQRRLDETAWRPREGCRHPVGRDDVGDRHLLERGVIDEEVSIGLRRWVCGSDRRWRRDALEHERRFSVDELDAATEYERVATELVERALERGDERDGRRRLLERWVAERPSEPAMGWAEPPEASSLDVVRID